MNKEGFKGIVPNLVTIKLDMCTDNCPYDKLHISCTVVVYHSLAADDDK